MWWMLPFQQITERKKRKSLMIEKYLDLARELKKAEEYDVIPMVVGTVGTVPKDLDKR